MASKHPPNSIVNGVTKQKHDSTFLPYSYGPPFYVIILRFLRFFTAKVAGIYLIRDVVWLFFGREVHNLEPPARRPKRFAMISLLNLNGGVELH
jgi:hypothetical protein